MLTDGMKMLGGKLMALEVTTVMQWREPALLFLRLRGRFYCLVPTAADTSVLHFSFGQIVIFHLNCIYAQ